jgi:hypothetical protein
LGGRVKKASKTNAANETITFGKVRNSNSSLNYQTLSAIIISSESQFLICAQGLITGR